MLVERFFFIIYLFTYFIILPGCLFPRSHKYSYFKSTSVWWGVGPETLIWWGEMMMISCLRGKLSAWWGERRANMREREGGGDGGRRGQSSFHLSISTSKATSTLLWFHQNLLSEEEEEEEEEEQVEEEGERCILILTLNESLHCLDMSHF